jgi:ATP-binding cassette, subfamily B, multidrug efflux pump
MKSNPSAMENPDAGAAQSTPATAATREPSGRWTFLLQLLKEHIGSFVLGTLLLGVTLWMTFAIPRSVATALDVLASPTPDEQGQFAAEVYLIVALSIAMVVTRTGSRLFFFIPGRRAEFDLKNRLLQHLCGLQRDFYLANPSGAIISRLNNDINGVRLLVGMGIMRLLTSVGTLSLAPYYMYQISPRLTLYCAIPLILGYAVVHAGLRTLRQLQVRQMRDMRSLSDFTVESFSGIDVLKAYRTYGWAQAQFRLWSDQVKDSAIRMSNIRAYCMPLLMHLTNALKMMVVLAGGIIVMNEGMSIGDLSAYLLYLSLLVSPLMGMTFMVFVLQRGFASLASLLEVLNSHPDLALAEPNLVMPSKLTQGLEVRGLSYAYSDEPLTPVLADISFRVAPDEVVGLFGSVGSGKSTLINLLNGYLQPPPGTVFFDDADVLRLGQERLRHHVVTVTQEPFLFSDTIRSNIALTRPDEHPTRDETDSGNDIALAAAGAALNTDLDRMPEGLETLVGERGITLSGGQKQRVSLARALLDPRNIILLDDVLSAVDHDTERFLVERIYALAQGRATVLVSHRISALEKANRILVLDHGRLVDTGTHAELITRDGPYRDAWALQRTTGDAQ